jgi:hypothetical protein
MTDIAGGCFALRGGYEDLYCSPVKFCFGNALNRRRGAGSEGVLRLRMNFAARRSCCAQDDEIIYGWDAISVGLW